MNQKKESEKEDRPPNRTPPRDRLPNNLQLKNLTNQPECSELQSLKQRIDDLEVKISHLESKIKHKRKRIRRKASEVQKKHKCEICKKMYGSMVSLNLHLRIKHNSRKESAEHHSLELQEHAEEPQESL